MQLREKTRRPGAAGVALPTANLSLFHAMVLSMMPPSMAAFVRHEGYWVDSRPVKLFSLSWPIVSDTATGRICRSGANKVFIPTPFSIECTSCAPIGEDLLRGTAERMVEAGSVRVGREVLEVISAKVTPNIPGSEVIEIEARSPVSVHVTDPSGWVEYLQPQDPRFARLLARNLARKHAARIGLKTSEGIDTEQIVLRPIGGQREQVAIYRRSQNMPIKGWWGRWVIGAPADMIRTALGAGLGAKCAIGFGCIGEVAA